MSRDDADGSFRPLGLQLPDYPWDQMTLYRQRAAQHPEGAVDLSIGTPIDPTPELIRQALARGADAPGYPTTHGTTELREAIAAWFARRRGVPALDPEAIMPTIGSKELVAWLPVLLGLGPGDVVVRPQVAYPTYDIGAQLAGAEAVPAEDLEDLPAAVRARVRLVWINSPGNPTGAVRDVASLTRLVSQARELGAVVASDECYAELGWGPWDEHRGGAPVPSVLDPRVAGGSHEGLLAVYSLSKQSNLAGYRAAFIAGAPELMPALINARKHAGMIVPAPVQAAMIAALEDDAHVTAQKDRYRARREALRPAVEAFGMKIPDSAAGLYLWGTVSRGGSPVGSWEAVEAFAELGIIVGSGTFYGQAGDGCVRISLTGSEERIASAIARLERAASSVG